MDAIFLSDIPLLIVPLIYRLISLFLFQMTPFCHDEYESVKYTGTFSPIGNPFMNSKVAAIISCDYFKVCSQSQGGGKIQPNFRGESKNRETIYYCIQT